MNRSATEARNFRTFLLVSELERQAITARIALARKEAGLTQEELADLLGVIPRTIQNYESNRVPWRHLKQIAEITGKPQAWFLHGEEDEEPSEELLLLQAIDRKLDLAPLEQRLVAVERELRSLRDAVARRG